MFSNFSPLISDIEDIQVAQQHGRVVETNGGLVDVSGLSGCARVGDLVEIAGPNGPERAEVLSLSKETIRILPAAGLNGVALGDKVTYIGDGRLRPHPSWLGRILDAYGRPLDGFPLIKGDVARTVTAPPPPAARRRRLGPRLETGVAALNTFLPLVRGQRIGLFAGSGVGKSSLLAQLAKGVEADFVVIALVGERGRELNEFIEDTLGADGLSRSVVVAATSDQSPVMRRRAAWTAMTIAEFLRDQGGQVLLLVDSVTRFCDAHREISVSIGEPLAANSLPASTAQQVMSLCERAGPGEDGQGDITAVFSVLVAGSDMEEPVADLTRGVLDGHVVLDRRIAERGRFPAIDVIKSVSRSLQKAHSEDRLDLLQEARALMAAYEDAELMIQAGLYEAGSDPQIDLAIKLRPRFERFLASGLIPPRAGSSNHFSQLSEILNKADTETPEEDRQQ